MTNSEIETKKRQLLAQLLTQLEDQLRAQNLWQADKPSPQALASREPFAIDTLTFVQWLQFIFIEKMRVLLAYSQALPIAVSIHPMATEYFKGISTDCREIEKIIARIDLLLNETNK